MAETTINDDTSMALSSCVAAKDIHPNPYRYLYSNPDNIEKAKRLNECWDKLYVIQRKIDTERKSYFEERAKWMKDNQHCYIDDEDDYFVKRCKWEIKHEEDHLKPLYDERDDASQVLISSAFWYFPMAGNKLVFKQITNQDHKVLLLLNYIKYSRTPNFKGFKLQFTFEKNSYFKNEFLTKTFEIVDDRKPVALEVSGTEIDWYPSKNLTQKKGRSCSSFFNFFSSYTITDPSLSFDKRDGELKGNLPLDYRIGIEFRDNIIPNVVVVPRRISDGESGEDSDSADDDEYGDF